MAADTLGVEHVTYDDIWLAEVDHYLMHAVVRLKVAGADIKNRELARDLELDNAPAREHVDCEEASP